MAFFYSAELRGLLLHLSFLGNHQKPFVAYVPNVSPSTMAITTVF
jgi:hypothetical protein